MKKILVVYYSRSGSTQKLAQRIADASGADLEGLVDRTPRDNAKGYLRSAIEAALHLKTQIQPITHAPDDYDLVVIGTPIWFWNMSSPIRAFITEYRHQFRWAAFFCTYGGSGQIKVLEDLTRLAGRPVLATLALTNHAVKSGHFRQPLARLVSQIKNTPLLHGAGSRHAGHEMAHEGVRTGRRSHQR